MYNFKTGNAPAAVGAGDEELKLPTPEPEEQTTVPATSHVESTAEAEMHNTEEAYASHEQEHYDQDEYDDNDDEEGEEGEEGEEEEEEEEDNENDQGGSEQDTHAEASDRGDEDDEENEEDGGGGVTSSDGQALSGLARTQRSAHVLDSYAPPSFEEDASGVSVLSYFRQFVEKFNVTPPRDWRQIRFDLPGTIAELDIYPPRNEPTQHKPPIIPTTTIIMNLKGLMPADTTVEDYMTQMIQYMFDVLQYVNATTAMTSVRFVKRGAAVTQMIVTLGRDRPLAIRVLSQLRMAGIPAGYSLRTHTRDTEPNATFQIRDYKFLLHDGRGISAEDVEKFLSPFRKTVHDSDIVVVEGLEPGLFFAPVKRPESIFSFLWNPTVSILLQRYLFEKLGVLITQASCPHDFLQKGVPYYIQKQQKDLERQQKMEEKAKRERAAEEKVAARQRRRGKDGELDPDDAEQQGDYERAGGIPAWARHAEQSVDIFGFNTITEESGPLKQLLKAAASSQPASTSTPITAAGATLPPPSSVGVPYGGGVYNTAPAQFGTYGAFDAYQGIGSSGGGGSAMGAGQGYGYYPSPPSESMMTSAPLQAPPPTSRGAPARDNDTDNDDEDDEDDAQARTAKSATPVRKYQMAKLDPMDDLEDEEGGSGANAGSLFFADVASSIGSADVFKHLLEPRGRGRKAADRPNAVPPTASTAVPGETDMYTGLTAAPPPVREAHSRPVHLLPPSSMGTAPLPSAFDSSYPASRWQPPVEAYPAPPQQPPQPAWVGSRSEEARGNNNNNLAISAGQTIGGGGGGAMFPSPHEPLAGYPHENGVAGGGGEYGSSHNNNNNGDGVGYSYGARPPSQGPPYGEPQAFYPPSAGPYGEPQMVMMGGAGGYYTNDYPAGPQYGGYGVDPGSALGAPWTQQQQPLQQQLPFMPDTMNSAVGGGGGGGGGGVLGNAYMRPAGISPVDADRLVVTIEEHLRSSFPKEYDAYMARVRDVEYLTPDGQEQLPLDDPVTREKQTTPLMAHITPESASLPFRGDELDALTEFIETEYVRVVQLLESRYVAELAEPRRRLLHCLLFALPAAEESQDWVPRFADEEEDEEEEAPGNGVNERSTAATAQSKSHEKSSADDHVTTTATTTTVRKVAYLPALLPYCLASDEGTEVVRAMLQLYPRHVSPLLARYVLPFLLDSNVVSALCVPFLYQDPRAENIVFSRLFQHWSALTAWLRAYVVAQSEKEAVMQIEHDLANTTPTTATAASGAGAEKAETTPEERAAVLDVALKAVRKRLASQVGNTLEQALVSLSFSQRVAVRQWSDTHNLLDNAFLRTETPSGTAIDLATGMWGEDGAVTRTLLRLYLSADAFDGRHLVEVLQAVFGTSDAHGLNTDSFFYFARALVGPGRANITVSRETCAFCGAYIRALEPLLLSPNTNTPTFTRGEKEVVQLLTTVVNALEEAAAAAASVPGFPYTPQPQPEISAAAVAFEALRVAYNTALAFEPSGVPHTHVPAIEHVIAHANIAVPLPVPQQPPMPMMGAPMWYGMQGVDPAQGLLPLPHGTPTPADAPSPLSELASRWQLEWTRKMSLYPAAEEPFTPLPTGWTSSLSRSYGHYYFKPPSGHGSPTYKHPTDATEFMATPQAFLHEQGITVTLEEVRMKANELIAAAIAGGSTEGAPPDIGNSPHEVQPEEAAAWFADQRKRNVGLDVATLEILQVRYRLSGHRRSQREPTTTTTQESSESASATRAPPAVARRVEQHTEEELAALLQRSITARQHYPAKGFPFPGLFKGWTVNMSALNGLYTFQPPRGPNPTIRHPQNRRYYRAAPQAFAEHRGLTAEEIAKATNGAKSVEEVTRWLADQRGRDRVLDKAVCDMVKVHYLAIPEMDDPQRSSGGAGAQSGSRSQDSRKH